MTKITLGDPAIAEIARLVQLAILTGTDVTDQLRTLSLTVENDVLTHILISPSTLSRQSTGFFKMLRRFRQRLELQQR